MFRNGWTAVVSLGFAVAQIAAQQPVEPNRIQPAGFTAKPIDKTAPPEPPAVDVPIQQLGKQFRLLGKLKLPLGEVARLKGLIVQTPGKGPEDGLSVRVFRINGTATQEFIQFKLSDYYGRDELPVQPGTIYELEGFETGGFIGMSAEAVQIGGPVTRTTAYRFVHEFKVIHAREITLQPFSPVDFLGREMLVQGQAVTEGGSAYIASNKWKVLIDNGTPWPKNTEGKTVEARGVIRNIGKSATYRLENGGKNNNAHLVDLVDQAGRQVSLRGTIIEIKGEAFFRYRGVVITVEGLRQLINQAGLAIDQEAQLTGTLESKQTPLQFNDGTTETRTNLLVRKGNLKATDPLLAIERAEPVE
ncbi:hypothetical protein [Anatilimnocola floriformis]|uniref:hypothetical protein n=1 Tax=Anatilimnocola floriformis TaxID=2948575 RepID=UPI0020C1D991|nr:hypothetical protein [Anatilimnocola floriformis]